MVIYRLIYCVYKLIWETKTNQETDANKIG